MSAWFLVSVFIVLGLLSCIVTGRWRYLFRLFAIRPELMTVEKLELGVKDAADAQRVNSILAGFAGGFNAMIRSPSTKACHAYCDSLPVFNRPFAEEGVAMGYTLRHLFRFDPQDFENQLVKQRPEYRYLYYVGLGFWSGMQKHSPEKVSRIAGGLDPLHQYLVYDGYGFKTAFFDYRSNPESLRTLDRLPGYRRNAAYQGVGRAFWFLYRDEHDTMIRRMTQFGEFAADAAAGAGLASVFVNPERLEVARQLGETMPASWQPHFQLGMCFALKARSINHLDQFDLDMNGAAPAVRDAAYASVRECDRIELQIRSDGKEDGYRRWRSRVTAWMVDQVEFPLAGLKHKSPHAKKQPAIPI